MVQSPKRLRLPARGRLVVATSLRGNLRDFQQVVDRYAQIIRDAAAGRTEGPAHLLLLGNLIHGPYLREVEWAERMTACGRYYRDESPAILLKLSLLMEQYPGQVVALVGHHELGHVGGPHTSKFADDETAALAARLSADTMDYLQGWLNTWPLWAVAPCGLLLSSAAPIAPMISLDELEEIDYLRHAPLLDDQATQNPAPEVEPAALVVAQRLGQLVWSHSLAPGVAEDVLGLCEARVAIYGHEVVSGHETIGGSQLILNSSFCIPDGDKRILLLDLSANYQSVEDLRPGVEILPLYS